MAVGLLILIASRLALPRAAPSDTCETGSACSARGVATAGGNAMLQTKASSMKMHVSGEGDLAKDMTRVAARTGASIDVIEDMAVSYGPAAKHLMDVRWPSEGQPAAGWPAVLILHGLGASRNGYAKFCKEAIVPSGRLCVAADYRTDDKYRQDDLMLLWDYFWGQKEKYNVDPASIVLSGCSQGGLTINNVIWDKKLGKELLGGSTPQVRAVMLLSGTWDSHSRLAEKAKYWPQDTYISSAEEDKTVPYKYSNRLYKALRDMGKSVEFVNHAGCGHSVWNKCQSEWFAAILKWLDAAVPTE